MACSEVQRTLVKSPPELWAEISDPAALARHLDAFGEIRITRVEPEQRVDWQAGDTIGSVVIKPSGWGTKVSLTVTSEHEPATEPTAHTEPAAGADPEPDPAAESAAPTVEANAAAGADPPAAPELAAGLAAEAPQPELEATPAPQREPDRFAGPEPDRVAAQPESDPAAPPPPASQSQSEPEPEPEPTIAPQPQPPPPRAESKPDPIIAVAEQDDEAAPATRRRRIFARLFARRRSNHAGELSPAADAHGPSASSAHAQETRDAAEPYNALAVWASQIQADDELPAERADQLQTSDAEHAAASEPLAGAAQQIAGHEVASSSEPAGQAASELEAIEQEASEQVTAVLTGVLDRLGAAHHRPFSRS
jgi:hypothetical protein